MPGSGSSTVLDDLPGWFVVEEILVRLPPKDLLRCRAMRKCWHSATSTDKFMQDYHRRQPLLPILWNAAVNQQYCRLFITGNDVMGQPSSGPTAMVDSRLPSMACSSSPTETRPQSSSSATRSPASVLP
ncbi:hypothetical protein ACQ4PT_024162 [Festuca glaucescens]